MGLKDAAKRLMIEAGGISAGARSRARARPAPDKSRRIYWIRSEEHTSELQSLMRISYAVFCLKKKKNLTLLNGIDLFHSNNKINKILCSNFYSEVNYDY